MEIPTNNGEILEKPSVVRDEHGRIVSGALNPNGKPKGTKHFATVLSEILAEQITLKDGKTMTVSKAIGMAIRNKALRGDVPAFNAIADRIDGKPMNDLGLDNGGNVVIQFANVFNETIINNKEQTNES